MKLNIKKGLWIVFTFNLLIAVVVWWAGSNVLKGAFESPIFKDFIESIPTITIENSTVKDPMNLNTSRSIGGMPLLYIQTDRDYVGVGSIQDGIYITRKAISIFNNGAVQTQLNLPEKGLINPEKIHTYFHRFAIWAPAILGALYILRLWIFYLLLVGLTALVSLIPTIRKKLAPCSVWRYAMWAHVGVLGTDFIANYFGYGLPVLTYYNFNLPIWMGILALFFVSMVIQLMLAWLVSTVIMVIATHHNGKKKN